MAQEELKPQLCVGKDPQGQRVLMLRWIGVTDGTEIPDRTFDFHLLTKHCWPGVTPHRVLYVGLSDNWPNLELREEFVRAFGPDTWIVTWAATLGGNLVHDEYGATLVMTFESKYGLLQPKEYHDTDGHAELWECGGTHGIFDH